MGPNLRWVRDTCYDTLQLMSVQAQVCFEDRDCLRKEEIEALQGLLDQHPD